MAELDISYRLPLISLTILLPLITAIFIVICVNLKDKALSFTYTSYVAVFGALLTVISSFVMLLYFDTDKVEESKKLYREIILSKNSFYSILALNILIEKELETDDVILNYFGKIENLDISKDQKDLIHLKKALFLIKNSKLNEANKLLNNLIESDSKLKNLAQDILTKK